MERKGATTTAVEQLFAHEAWLRRVASSLAPGAADDLVQETWIAAMRRPPDADRPVRPWLARVVRNLARMRHRGQTRREAREREVVAEAAASPETLVAQLEAHQRLGGLILGLPEPQRQVLLLSFGEGLTSAEIANRLGVPAGTVRWRLKTALDELRLKLGVEDAPRARFALLAGLWKGLAVVKTSKLAAAALVLLIVAFFAGKRWIAPSPASSQGPPAQPAVAARPVMQPDADPARARRVRPAWMAEGGSRARRVAGQVTTPPPRAPIAGARVRLIGDDTEAGAALAVERVTGPDGRFDFGLQPAGTHRVAASAPGRAPVAVDIDLRGPVRKPAADALKLELGPCENTVSGEVTDGDGVPLAGALVEYQDASSLTTTDDDGGYELCVTSERVFLTASAAGYASVAKAVRPAGKARLDFTLGAGVPVVCEVLRQDDGRPVPNAIVHGFPMGDLTVASGRLTGMTDSAGKVRFEAVLPSKMRFNVVGDGVMTTDYNELTVVAGRTNEVQLLVEEVGTLRGAVRDERGAPVGGAVIAAIEAANEYSRADTVTQEDGSFVLGWARKADVRLTVSEHLVVSPKTLSVGGDMSGLDVRVTAGRLLRGRVQTHGRPVAGARVFASDFVSERASTTSDEDGVFELAGLQPRVFRVMTSRNGNFASAFEVDLRQGDARDLLVELPEKVRITGTVVDEEGAPVAGADVRWRSGLGMIRIAVTKLDGTFRLEGMTGGDDCEAIVSLNGAPLAPAVPFPLARLSAADEADDLRLVVRVPRATIAGVVVDGSGGPVAGVTVEATGANGSRGAVRTGADGAFLFTRMAPGSYDLSASSADGTQGTAAPGIAAGREDVRIVLGATASITGKVVGFRVDPEVRLQSLRPPYDLVAMPTTYRRFEARALLPGDYVLTAQTADEQAVAAVTVAPAARLEVELVSQGTGKLHGTAIDHRTTAPIRGASCGIVPRAGDVVLVGAGVGNVSVLGDERGVFSLVTPAGDLRVVCQAPGYTRGSAAVTVARDQTATVQVRLLRTQGAPASPGFKLDPWSVRPRVLSVDENGAAAGLRPGDVIVAVADTPVAGLDVGVVYRMIAEHPAGTAVELTTQRGTVSLTLR